MDGQRRRRDWQGVRVLVTGAGGFIGSHLVDELVRAGASVRALVRYNSRGDQGLLEMLPESVRKEVEVIAADVRDSGMMSRAVSGCAVVFHLAALIGIPYSYEAPRSYVEVNVRGTLNLLEAALFHGVSRFVLASTSEVYGSARYVPMDELHPLCPQSPYAASKAGADHLADSYYRAFQLPVAVVRPFNTFGPRQSARAIIPTIVTQALEGGVVFLGDLRPVRDFTYVTDTVAGFLEAAVRDEAVGGVVNLGSGQGITIGELVARIGQALGRPLEVRQQEERFRPPLSEVVRLTADTTKARQVLGWRPRVSLDEGLLRVVEWFREHSRRYRPGVYAV